MGDDEDATNNGIWNISKTLTGIDDKLARIARALEALTKTCGAVHSDGFGFKRICTQSKGHAGPCKER